MKKLSSFWQHNKGSVLVEFAFILPILLILTFPLIDYARYILLQQKVIKTAYVIADAITMSREIDTTTTAADIAQKGDYMTNDLINSSGSGTDLIDSVPDLMQPFVEQPGDDRWQVVISHVRKPDAASPPLLTWQYDENSRSYTGAPQSSVGSVVGFNNTVPATLPAELISSMGDGENIIVVEVTARHDPIVPDLSGGIINAPFLGTTDVEYTAYMRARYGNLQYIWNVNCPPTSVNCP